MRNKKLWLEYNNEYITSMTKSGLAKKIIDFETYRELNEMAKPENEFEGA